jgi:hypothetical protein
MAQQSDLLQTGFMLKNVDRGGPLVRPARQVDHGIILQDVLAALLGCCRQHGIVADFLNVVFRQLATSISEEDFTKVAGRYMNARRV